MVNGHTQSGGDVYQFHEVADDEGGEIELTCVEEREDVLDVLDNSMLLDQLSTECGDLVAMPVHISCFKL